MTLVAAMERTPGPGRTDRWARAWLGVHIVLVLAGYAALLLPRSASSLYLIQERRLKSKKPALLERLPPLATLDNLISGSLGVAFVLITLAVVLVIMWEFMYSGTAWIGDPRVMVSLVTWALLLTTTYLHATAGWRGRKAAVMALVVLGCSIVHLGRACGIESDADPMKLLITGLNHRTAPVEVRERLAFEEKALPEALDQLKQRPGLLEGMILSTCNRVEVAVTADEETDARSAVEGFLAESRAWRATGFRRICIATTVRKRSGTCSAWLRAWIRWWWASRRFWGR